MPLLPGTDGVQKMSKSLGNYIGIDEPANEIYGKAMSLPDEQIVPYSEYLTDIAGRRHRRDAAGAGRQLGQSNGVQEAAGTGACGAVLRCECGARGRRGISSGLCKGEGCRGYSPSSRCRLPRRLPNMRLSRLLVDAGLASSAGEARRLIDQGAVQIDGERVNEDSTSGVAGGCVLRAGRRRFVRLV